VHRLHDGGHEHGEDVHLARGLGDLLRVRLGVGGLGLGMVECSSGSGHLRPVEEVDAGVGAEGEVVVLA